MNHRGSSSLWPLKALCFRIMAFAWGISALCWIPCRKRLNYCQIQRSVHICTCSTCATEQASANRIRHRCRVVAKGRSQLSQLAAQGIKSISALLNHFIPQWFLELFDQLHGSQIKALVKFMFSQWLGCFSPWSMDLIGMSLIFLGEGSLILQHNPGTRPTMRPLHLISINPVVKISSYIRLGGINCSFILQRWWGSTVRSKQLFI